MLVFLAQFLRMLYLSFAFSYRVWPRMTKLPNTRFEFRRVACPIHKVRWALFAAQAERWAFMSGADE